MFIVCGGIDIAVLMVDANPKLNFDGFIICEEPKCIVCFD